MVKVQPPVAPDMGTDCDIQLGDTAWVLISTVLVLGMMPALAFFEAGLLRSKNTLSIVTQVFAGLSVLCVMWVFFGYSLTFGPTVGNFIGDLSHAFLLHVPYDECNMHASNIPAAAYALFFMMFAAITPLLMTGSYAERLSWKASLLMTIGFELFVFYPIAHHIWGGGWLSQMGALDFAGGIVIHTSAGVGSLVCALYLGQRANFEYYHGEFPPSSLPLAALGAALLWMGWFGFNGGSALAAGPVAVSAVISTQIACCCSSVTWMCCNMIMDGRPSTVGIINGALAGLAGITPASGFIDSQASIILGIVLGGAAFTSSRLMKTRLGIDDALDVSSVHGLTGVIGSLAIGLVSRKSVNPNGDNGAFYGNPRLLGIQLLAVVFTIVWAGFFTYVLLRIIDKVLGGIVHSDTNQLVGLDWVEHKEVAYHDLHVLDQDNPAYRMDQLVHTLPSNETYFKRKHVPPQSLETEDRTYTQL